MATKKTFEVMFSTYLSEISDKETLDNNLNLVYNTIHEHDLQNTFDSIAFSGMSGALYSPLLAHKMDKFLCGVRKKGEKSHSDYKIEGRITNSYIYVDDIVSTGKSIEYIHRTINDELRKESKCFGIKPAWQAKLVGIILYGLGNDEKILQGIANKYDCWVLWQDKLITPKDEYNED